MPGHDAFDLSPQLEIAWALPTLVGLPLDAPLLLEAPTVGFEKARMRTVRIHASQRALAKVVDEDVLGAHAAVPSTVSALGVVVWSMVEFEADDVLAAAGVRVN